MTDFESTPLWTRTLARFDGDIHDRHRERLRNAYLQFRDRVKYLAEDIKISMPMYTDHGIDHIDSLWDTASIICGDAFPINPAEAFVLGGSFLLHDLGMGLSAYPEGREKLEKEARYLDILASMREEQPKGDESDLAEAALAQFLRLRHARQAEELMKRDFKSATKPPVDIPLCEDSRLRAAYGPLIGRLAHSHWFDVSSLQKEFPKVLGSLPDLPDEWKVDPLKLACVLRLADAAHIDSRRAPLFLAPIRKLTGLSKQHWDFQQKLTRPNPVEDRLEYTAVTGFSAEEAASWWLAYEAASSINSELRQVDALFADSKRERFAIRSVAGAESPLRFAEFVKTHLWTPIDASLRVSKVAPLIESLGGEALYGRTPEVALREVISNAADATRARRTLFGGSELAIEVTLDERDGRWCLTVRDRGLGMTREQVVQYLTDFGRSYWTSGDRIDEYPGLLSKGYKSTGKFGIGFFATFMIADRVEVRTLKFRGASSTTSVLEFPNGLATRPLLRASEDDVLELGGTEVTMYLKKEPRSDGGLFDVTTSRFSDEVLLERMLVEMCPLLDVDLKYRIGSDTDFRTAVRADDWKTMPAGELYDRLYGTDGEMDPMKREQHDAYRRIFETNVEDLVDEDGDLIGRATLAAGLDELVSSEQWWWPSLRAAVCVGGMKADHLWDVMGVFVGKPTTASRNSAFPIASLETIQTWAESQARKNRDLEYSTPMSRYGAAQLVYSVGASPTDLPCAFVREGLIGPSEIVAWVQDKDSVVVVWDYQFLIYYDEDRGVVVSEPTRYRLLRLPDNFIVMSSSSRWMFPDEVSKPPVDERFKPHIKQDSKEWDPAWYWHNVGGRGPAGVLLDAAAGSWNSDVVTVGLGAESCQYSVETGDRRVRVELLDGSSDLPFNGMRIPRPTGGPLQSA